MSQLDWLNNRTVKGTGSIVPNVKQKPKRKFREFLTRTTSLSSFCSSLFIGLHPPIDKKAWHHIFFLQEPISSLYTGRTSDSFTSHLKNQNNRVLLHSILLPLSPLLQPILLLFTNKFKKQMTSPHRRNRTSCAKQKNWRTNNDYGSRSAKIKSFTELFISMEAERKGKRESEGLFIHIFAPLLFSQN